MSCQAFLVLQDISHAGVCAACGLVSGVGFGRHGLTVEFVKAWTRAGYKVLGAAVKGEAARTLGSVTGIPTETLAWHLAHEDPATSPLDARTVLIVDEASTVSDADLDRLLWHAHATGRRCG